MYKIQANQSGTRSIEVSDLHLETIDKYQLLRNLVLEKLKLNVRALLEADNCQDKALLDLCLDVIYNSNMKALGLHNLVLLYVDWLDKRAANEAEDTNAITD